MRSIQRLKNYRSVQFKVIIIFLFILHNLRITLFIVLPHCAAPGLQSWNYDMPSYKIQVKYILFCIKETSFKKIFTIHQELLISKQWETLCRRLFHLRLLANQSTLFDFQISREMFEIFYSILCTIIPQEEFCCNRETCPQLSTSPLKLILRRQWWYCPRHNFCTMRPI